MKNITGTHFNLHRCIGLFFLFLSVLFFVSCKRELSDKEKQIQKYFDLADENELRDPEKSFLYYNSIENILKNDPELDKKYRDSLNIRLGSAYLFKCDTIAEAYYRKVKRDSELYPIALIGLVYIYQGDAKYADALELFYKIDSIESDDTVFNFNRHYSKGTYLYYYEKDYGSGIKEYKKGLRFARNFIDSSNTIYAIGELFRMKALNSTFSDTSKMYRDSSKVYFMDALRLSRGEIYSTANAFEGIADLLSDDTSNFLRLKDTIFTLYTNSGRLFKQTGSKFQVAGIYVRFADFYLSDNKMDVAKMYADSAWSYATSINARELMFDAADRLYKTSTNDSSKIVYLNQYISLYKEIVDQNNKKVSIIKKHYYDKDLMLEQRINNRYTIFVIILAIILGVILLLLIRINRQKIKNEKFSIAAKETKCAVTIMDSMGNFEWANKGFEKLYGYTLAEFIAARGSRNLTDVSSDPAIAEKVKESISKNTSVEYESEILTADGKTKILKTTLTPAVTRKGVRLVVIDTDITELKQIQSQLFENKKLEQLGYVVRGISHEISTPIANCVSDIELIKLEISDYLEKNHDPSCNEFYAKLEIPIQRIFKNLESMGELLNSYNNIARDDLKGEKRFFNIVEKINDLLFSLKHRIDSKNVVVVTSFSGSEDVMGYPGALTQIMINLILNSLKHGFAYKPDGQIQINISVDKSSVTIDYSDNGSGISRENLPHIFDMFFTTMPSESSGLGLSIVKRITENIGGTISCTSKLNEGVNFIIKLPMD